MVKETDGRDWIAAITDLYDSVYHLNCSSPGSYFMANDARRLAN